MRRYMMTTIYNNKRKLTPTVSKDIEMGILVKLINNHLRFVKIVQWNSDFTNLQGKQ